MERSCGRCWGRGSIQIKTQLLKKVAKKLKAKTPIPQKEVQDKLVDFFWKNPNPKDTSIHSLADDLNLEAHELENNIYMLLTSLIHLKGSEKPDSFFDAKQLAMGIEVEKEHHDNLLVRRNIAVAHLLELADYYSRLKAIENG